MAQLFPRWSNTACALGLGTVVGGASLLVIAPMIYARTDYGTHRGELMEQPVAFDHRHHVRDVGVECVYCHRGVEHEAQAGLPATEVCMGCHSQVRTDSELLAPVRASYATSTPLVWKQVHTLPDFVYFHHGVHVQGGIPCQRCHGAVEDMARVYRVAPLNMDWCLDCHREHNPRGDEHAVTSLTTCTACHR